MANPPEDLVAKYTRKEREFFFGYANFVLRLFNSPEVNERLRHLMEIENVRISKAIDLRVMVFPARPFRGRPRNVLHGSYNHDTAQISIYPLKVKRNRVRQEGFSLFKTPLEQLSGTQREMIRDILLSAVSTLIHEVLHVKFETRNYSRYAEEAIVRKLERKYAQEWIEQLPETLTETRLPLTPLTWAIARYK